MEPEVQHWLDFAAKDLGVANHLMECYHPIPLEHICFLSQQASEKTIKAVYLSLDIPSGLPHKHDLTFLLDQMKNRVDIPEDIYDHADSLNIYAINIRYPNEMQLNVYMARKALQYANEIMEWGTGVIQKIHGASTETALESTDH